jgi:hypothetical protein
LILLTLETVFFFFGAGMSFLLRGLVVLDCALAAGSLINMLQKIAEILIGLLPPHPNGVANSGSSYDASFHVRVSRQELIAFSERHELFGGLACLLVAESKCGHQ